MSNFRFIEQDTGPLRIWREPEPGMVYTVGVDASTGLAEDYTSMQVLSNALPFEQVAHFRGRWPVNEVTAFADKLGRFYNEALMIVEINYPGNSVQDALLQFYKYPRNYQPEEHLNPDPDIAMKYGLKTTDVTKWMLINETQMILAAHETVMHDPVTISEFLNFVYQACKRKCGAAEGFNDDSVIAYMLALHGCKLYPCIRPQGSRKLAPKKQVSPEAIKAWGDLKRKLAITRSRQGTIV